MSNFLKYMDLDDYLKIKNCDDLYLKSAVLARMLFRNRVDKSGNPYIGHLYRVSSSMTTYNGMIAGLLHDMVEDIPYITFDDLKDIGINDEIIKALVLVTNEPDPNKKELSKQEKLEKYNKKIDNIINSGDDLALELKIADISDNYNAKRLSYLPLEKLIWFNSKYGKNIVKLKDERGKRKKKC